MSSSHSHLWWWIRVRLAGHKNHNQKLNHHRIEEEKLNAESSLAVGDGVGRSVSRADGENQKLQRTHQEQRQTSHKHQKQTVKHHPRASKEVFPTEQHGDGHVLVTTETHEIPERALGGAVQQVEANLKDQDVQEGARQRLRREVAKHLRVEIASQTGKQRPEQNV